MGIATILSIIVSLTPIIPMIKGAIQGAEDVNGPGGGDNKKDLVVQAATPLVKILKDKGKLPADLDVEQLGQVVDVIFTLMKTGKELIEQKSSEAGGISNYFESLGLKKGVAYPITIQGETKGTIKLAVQP